jgi:hypothetical protein
MGGAVRRLPRLVALLLLMCVPALRGEPAAAPYAFGDADGDRRPDGYVRHKSQEDVLSYEAVPPGAPPVLRLQVPDERYVYLDSMPFPLEADAEYLFVIDVSIVDARHPGAARRLDHALAFYVHAAAGGRHTAHWISGRGSTPGWVTVVIPFSTARMPELARARILIRSHRLAATIRLCDPAIVRLPKGARMVKHVVLESGEAVLDPGLVLR